MLKIQYTPEKTIDLHTEKILELPVIFCGILEEAAEYTARGGANTPYDDAFHTLALRCPELLIPLVNLAFGLHYTGREKVLLESNEHYIRNPDGKPEKRITDGKFRIIGEKTDVYHLEYMAVPRGDVAFRAVEYGTYIALQETELSGNVVTMRYPRSVIVYLRSTRNTPDHYIARILADGGEVSYRIPTLCVPDYSLEQLLERRLYFFLPFCLFRYEKEFPKMEDDGQKRAQMLAEFEKLPGLLKELNQKGDLSDLAEGLLTDLLKYVAEHMVSGYPEVKKGVEQVMYGKGLELESLKLWDGGVAKGRAEGRAEGRRTGVLETLTGLVKSRLLDETVAAERAGMSLAEFRKLLI